MYKIFNLFLIIVICSVINGKANNPSYIIKKQFEITSVKNQWRSNTCWSFATLSMIETELIQKGKGQIDLSEMFVVRMVYLAKAERYIRFHGYIKFTGGGSTFDVIDIIKQYGIMPQNAYPGLEDSILKHNHIEMDTVLHNYVDSIIDELVAHKNLTTNWEIGYNKLLNKYLGVMPQQFQFNNQTYNAKTFAQFLDINCNDYLLLMSFNIYPFYQKTVVEMPDNWNFCSAINVPLNEFIEIAQNSVNKGYSLSIACDVSEKGFDWHKGIAILNNDSVTVEPEINDNMRALAFNNYQTTDDHAMHIIGLANDTTNKPFWLLKNSWGVENTSTNGLIYMSSSYFKYKTLTMLINKKSLTSQLTNKILINDK